MAHGKSLERQEARKAHEAEIDAFIAKTRKPYLSSISRRQRARLILGKPIDQAKVLRGKPKN